MTLQMARPVGPAPAVLPEYADEWPEGWPRHARDQRPKIRTVEDPTRMVFYRRPSSFGDGIESSFLIDRRDDCLMLVAAQRWPHLVDETAAALAQQSVEGDPLDDPQVKSALRAVRTKALELAGANAKANRGTAIHKLWERRLAGQDLAFLGPQLHACVDAYTRLLEAFTVHAVELRVVNDAHGTAGTTDVVVSPRWPMTFELPAGPVEITPEDVLIGDGKTGAHVVELGRVARGVQLAEYAEATPYEHVPDEAAAPFSNGLTGDDGRRTWTTVGVPGAPRQDIALVFHVPQDSPQDAGVVALDLTRARRLADLAAEIWEARALAPSDLFVPVQVPPAPSKEEVEVTVVERDGHEIPGCGHDVLQVHCDACSAESARRLAERIPRGVQLYPRALAPSDVAATALAMIRKAETTTALGELYTRYREVWDPAVHGVAADEQWAKVARKVVSS